MIGEECRWRHILGGVLLVGVRLSSECLAVFVTHGFVVCGLAVGSV